MKKKQGILVLILTAVVIGLLAFVIGVTVTVLCIRLKNKSTNRTLHTQGSEERV